MWKVWLSKSKKFVFRPVFEELQLRQISLNFKTSCCNLKKRSGSKNVCGFSIIFISERSCFGETNLVPQLIWELQIKRETVMIWSLQKKKQGIFCTIYFVQKNFFINIWALSQCIPYWIHFQNIHTFTYQKASLHALFCLFLKSSKALSVLLRIAQS